MDAEKARDKVRDALVADYANTLMNDRDARYDVAERGFKGFVHMLNAELVQAAKDAGVGENDEDVAEAIEVLDASGQAR